MEELINSFSGNYEMLGEKIQSLRVLDPACGEGVFIKSTIEILLRLNLKIATMGHKEGETFNSDKTELQLKKEIIRKNVYGVDSDEKAIESLRRDLFGKLKSQAGESIKEELSNSLLVGNSIVADMSLVENGIRWGETFERIMKEGGFNIILGNPPWGAELKGLDEYFRQQYPSVAKGQFDSFGIFLYVAIEKLLKDKGVLGFIVPNELLLLEQYRDLRAYLLKYQLCELINLGFGIFGDEVQKPALLLILRKEKYNRIDSNGQSNVLVRVNIKESERNDILKHQRSLKAVIDDGAYYRSQQDFLKNKDNIFDIFSKSIDREIKHTIESNKFKPLKTYFISGRGMDTNRNGRHIICPKCSCLNPPFGRGHSGRVIQKECQNPDCGYSFLKEKKKDYPTEDLILEKRFEEGPYHAPGYIGQDLHRFYFNREPRLVKYYGDCEHEGKFSKYRFVGWKDPQLYKGEKILIRKVSSGHVPQVMVAKDFLIGNQQIYFFKKKDQFHEISIYFYLGILTSRLIHYYYLRTFGDPDKDVMPHFTQSNLKKLPVPKPNPDEPRYKELINLTKRILQLVKKYHSEKQNDEKKHDMLNKIQSVFNRLDDIVFQYYSVENAYHKKRIVDIANQNGFTII
jgi:hypothetical protein